MNNMIEIESPPVVQWLGATSPAWLVEDATRLAQSASMFDRVASVGLVARHWRHTPWTRAPRSWAHKLTDAQQKQVALWAVDRADRLHDEVPFLEEALRATPQRRDVALAWVLERDNLDSVLEVLRSSDQEDFLGDALAAIDRTASIYASMWSLCPGFDSPRLLALQDIKPWMPWWAGLYEAED